VSPNPLAADGAVVLDLDAQTATVVPAETGYPAMLWRHGYEKLVRLRRADRLGAQFRPT
jgi:hypothetical protein